MTGKKISITIVGEAYAAPSTEAFLEVLLNILTPLCDPIYVIGGNFPANFIDNITWIPVKNRSTLSSGVGVNRIINYISNQLNLTIKLVNNIISDDTSIIFFIACVPLPMIFSKLLGKKIVSMQGGTHLTQPHITKANIIMKYFLIFWLYYIPCAVADKIIVGSKDCIKFQKMENFIHKIAIAPLYTDLSIFRIKEPFRHRGPFIGYIGNLDENKGVDKLCQAISISFSSNYLKNFKFIIYGQGVLLDNLKSIISSSMISDRVKILGWLPHESVVDALNKLQLLVLPSNSEGLPKILLEALACGTPVLSTAVGGIPDIIKNEETGFIIENNHPDTIAEGIVRAITYSESEKIINNGIDLIRTEYSYEKVVERFRIIFNNLVKEG